jgi:hypothetical protein
MLAPPGVRHALLPPAGDGSSAPCGAELFLFTARKTLRTTSGRAGAAVGASRASRTPECGIKQRKESIVIPNP